jgi:hypothetical protein
MHCGGNHACYDSVKTTQFSVDGDVYSKHTFLAQPFSVTLSDTSSHVMIIKAFSIRAKISFLRSLFKFQLHKVYEMNVQCTKK